MTGSDTKAKVCDAHHILLCVKSLLYNLTLRYIYLHKATNKKQMTSRNLIIDDQGLLNNFAIEPNTIFLKM
ncbi:hypothetical protein E5S67_06116 [Microcoleus sp. IPMA8]|uniref:Transposase n=1 Tax=Microcoleus asticus IPMA8 TaxID=2563858 RepID=A0ABX2D702_9CYAN|nr:hypothetical protein [Microcoleus asticus IPMA8]